MNIAVITSSISRNAGGLFNSVRRLTQNIEKPEHNVRVFGIEDEHSHKDIEAWAPIKPELFPKEGLSLFPSSIRMKRSIIEADSDIIHCHGLWTYPSIIDLAARAKCATPYIVSPRGMLDPWALNNSKWKKTIARLLFEERHLKQASCLQALCTAEAEAMRSFGLTNPIAIIPNGTDLPEPTAETSSQDKKTLLYLGRIHPKKNLAGLIHAWSKLNKNIREEWKLIIAGWDDGGHEEKLKQVCSNLNLGDSVSFIGPHFEEKKDKLLRSCDAFILPSFSEGLPMSILEAWAYSLPVMMTEECNLPDGFSKEAAFPVSSDADGMAEEITQFLNLSDSDREKMGQNGRNVVNQNFAWNSMAEDMLNVYSWCVNGGDVPDCVML